jgi:hypothetical protein
MARAASWKSRCVRFHVVDHGPFSAAAALAGAQAVIPHAGARARNPSRTVMNNIIYIIGLVVVVIAILSFLGMR